jgi:predicted amidohydrolase YtcJ
MAARIFTGGRILTMDPALGEPEALVVADGRIAAAGQGALRDAHPGAEVVDLAGRTLLPGLIDAHYHLSIAALHPLMADLRDARGIEEIGAALREAAAREPDTPWVRGHGWTHEHGVPTRADLDALGLDRPILVAHFSYHQGVVCSRGLEELGVGRGTPDPPGGLIERGPDGEPTGLLVEAAWSQAHARSLEAYADPDRWAEHIEARTRLLWRDGITAVHDAACPPAAEDVFRRLAAEGRLGVSVLALPHPAAILAPPDPGRLAGPPTGEGDETLRVGPAKLFADGGVAPAIDATLGGRRIAIGHLLPDLARGVAAAAERGFRVAIHAMGNVGIARALDALRELARDDDDHRPRIEHATLLSAEQARELARVGAVAVVQPGFVDLMGPAVERFTFDEVVWLPFAMLAQSGITLAGSSDHPCALDAPLLTSCHGVTRRATGGSILGADQALAYEDWLRAYTAGAAYAGGQEHERGTLTPGKRADLAVLEGALDPERPPRVVETWVAGERVWRA